MSGCIVTYLLIATLFYNCLLPFFFSQHTVLFFIIALNRFLHVFFSWAKTKALFLDLVKVYIKWLVFSLNVATGPNPLKAILGTRSIMALASMMSHDAKAADEAVVCEWHLADSNRFHDTDFMNGAEGARVSTIQRWLCARPSS